MIDDPNPKDWRDLQTSVCRLLNEIGLTAETEKKLTTPRGEVKVDVYAVDQGSVDKIKYIVECKNWSAAIPQSVVHSFTTVMAETGANIGFLVSQQGLQRGAEKYTANTNIIGMTYLDLQLRYFDLWWEKCFCRHIGNLADEMMDFVEPYNPRRDELVADMSQEKIGIFNGLLGVFGTFCLVMTHLNIGRYVNLKEWGKSEFPVCTTPNTLDDYKNTLLTNWPQFPWGRATNFRELKFMIEEIVVDAHANFRDVFGGEIDEVYSRR
ncbi:restriction endonuclease [Comamonas antarctica]|uniref:Restriction endonuclease n=1 Tax=Comamonas antarctica TaxID=2743470 RepID=A0A6N1WY92_9BURK|nr:restriction endonuclease [Comamonas antarctica]QKV52031.1 restriction endonuclease [Comamonas antarctica]